MGGSDSSRMTSSGGIGFFLVAMATGRFTGVADRSFTAHHDHGVSKFLKAGSGFQSVAVCSPIMQT